MRTHAHQFIYPGERYAARFEQGQMAVELAVVTPVLLLVFVIVFDMLVFMSECARFDHIAPQQVLACATTAPIEEASLDARCARIQAALGAEFAKNGSSVSVEYADADMLLSSMVSFTCTFRFAPWPFNLSGAPPRISHNCSLVVDPYVPGEIL